MASYPIEAPLRKHVKCYPENAPATSLILIHHKVVLGIVSLRLMLHLQIMPCCYTQRANAYSSLRR